jgi:hypothetical protein
MHILHVLSTLRTLGSPPLLRLFVTIARGFHCFP